ncbi:MAG TPA: DoxX family protein [Nitrospira sp.]|nr:DoxX family protein [Nitrospira sp.]
MKQVFARFEPFAFALFRAVFGLLFLQFGTQKLFGWPNTANVTLTPLLRAAGCIELTCGVCILLGFVTAFAALMAAGEMAFAYFLGHFPLALWPIVNKGVPAVLFCFAFLFIATHGSGIWSVDSLLSTSKINETAESSINSR